jgi:hypothetical protein
MLYLTRPLPIWLRLLICTLALVPFCPVLLIHEGGGALLPVICFLTNFDYLGSLKQDDLKSFALQISFAWGMANCFLLIVVGLRYFIRKAKAKHVA